MPGPMFGQIVYHDARKRHQKCQQGERCIGPGCRLQTGKTDRKRRNRERRKR